MLTVQRPMQFGTVLIMLGLVAGCTQSQTMPEAIETERELCIQWRDSLPTRSRIDTDRTQQEIGYAYDVQAVACPNWARFQ